MQRRSRRRRLRTCFKLRQLLLLVLPLLQLFSVAYFLGSLHLGIYLHLHWPPVRKLLLPATAAVVHFILQIVCRNLCLVLAASVASQIYELSYTYEHIYIHTYIYIGRYFNFSTRVRKSKRFSPSLCCVCMMHDYVNRHFYTPTTVFVPHYKVDVFPFFAAICSSYCSCCYFLFFFLLLSTL